MSSARSTTGGVLAVGALLASLCLSPLLPAAWAEDAAPAGPPRPVETAVDDPAPAPPVVEGSAPGLIAPTPEEKQEAVAQCLHCPCLPEVYTPLYDPASRMQIPWTGGWNPRDRHWTVFAGESLTYDSNIFATEREVQSDWIANTTVGASYRREGAAYWVLATAVLTYAAFFEHTEESDLQFWGEVNAGWKGACAYATLTDRVAHFTSPLVIRDDTMTILNQEREGYWQDTLSARVGYEGPCLRAEVAYVLDWFMADGGTISQFDHWDHGITGRVDYYVSDKTSIGAYAGARYLPFSDDAQSDLGIWSAGSTFSWRPTAKVGLLGSLGWTQANVDGGDDHGTVCGNLGVSFDPVENLSLVLGWARSFEPSLGAEDQILDLYSLRVQSVFDGCWTFNAATGLQTGDVQGSTPNGARDYSLWFLEFMVHHPVGDHWAVDFSYQYRKQDSVDTGIDFDEHRVTVGASFAF